MLAYRYPIIAREGWMWIALVIAAAALSSFKFGIASVPLWILAATLLFLFRDPYRKIPASPLAVVCPVDGKIVAIDKIQDDYLDRAAICISIKMGMIDVFSVHSPMEGKIIKQWHEAPLKIKPITTDKNTGTATDDAGVETFAQWMQSDENDDVVLIMEANTFIPKPYCYAQSGDRIGQGQRCGFLRFGTQVDVIVPESTRIDVNVGDKVLAGTGIIATLVRIKDGSSVTEAVANT